MVRPHGTIPIPAVKQPIAGKIEAYFQAAGMKTAAPINVPVDVKIVPLDAEPLLCKVAVQRLPCPADMPPRRALVGGRRVFRKIESNGVGSFQDAPLIEIVSQ